MAHDVFISYSSKDKSIADAVCSILEKTHIRCWIAPRDITPGTPFAEAIIDGMQDAKVFVLIFSSNSNKSPQVMREVERAVHHGLPIIPLRIEDVPMSKQLEFYVSDVHWLDALSPPLENHIHKLSQVIQMLLSLNEKEDEAFLRAVAAKTEIKQVPEEKTRIKEGNLPHVYKPPPSHKKKKFLIPLLFIMGVVIAAITLFFFIQRPAPVGDPPQFETLDKGGLDTPGQTDTPAIEVLREPADEGIDSRTIPPEPDVVDRQLVVPEPPPLDSASGETSAMVAGVRAGIDAFNQGNYDQSIRYMEGVLEGDPENIYALYYLSESKKKLEPLVQSGFEHARQAYEDGYYEASIEQLEKLLQLDPGHAPSLRYLELARANLSSQQISLIIHQYVRSVENSNLLEFYERNCSPPLFERISNDIRLMLQQYNKLKATVSGISIRYVENSKAMVTFSCLMTGVLPGEERRVLFEGEQDWVVLKQGDTWRIDQIEFRPN
ncbi:MAG: TIR domain-containing protein [Bacteroidales bacterium]